VVTRTGGAFTGRQESDAARSGIQWDHHNDVTMTGEHVDVMWAADDGSDQLAADEFRSVLRHQASTVAVVTAPGPAPTGFTATSFTSVSLRPPLISVNLARDSTSWPTIRTAEHIAVNLLTEDQERVARAFAVRGVDRLAGYRAWRPGPYGVPLLGDVLAWMVCRVTDRVVAGDHVIVVAAPLTAQHAGRGAPLLYHHGRYARLDSVTPDGVTLAHPV